MADPNDDLLEDGDIADGHFELDLADEDALLADDYDEKPMKSIRTSETGRGHQNIEDEDFIEIGVDEDLALADESKNEGDNGKNIRKTIVFDDSNNDDSDEGGKERTRFKTERNINAVPRPTASIPETLDAVALKSQPHVAYMNRGARGGGPILRRNFRGIFRGGFQRGITQFRFRAPHPQFGPIPHMQMPLKQPPIDVGQVHQPYHFPQVMNEPYNTPGEDCYQAPPAMPQPPYPNPVVQPPATNIHVNPHFRGPRPQVNQNLNMWNGTNYAQASQNLQSNFQPAPPPYQNQYQPNQASQWSEGGSTNDYYSSQNAVTPGSNYGHGEQYYNGVNTGADPYYHQQQPPQQQSVQSNYQPVGPNVGSNLAPPQMNWNDNSYYGGQQTSTVSGPQQDIYNPQMNQHLNQPHMFGGSRPPHHHHMQLQHKKPFIPMVNKKYIFKNIKFQAPVVRGRGGKLLNMRKEPIQPNKLTPPKPVRVETGALRKIQITNLHEVPVTNTPVQKKNIPEPEEEDEEMKAYRKKIEEQKKLREQVLKQKEEKRKVAAQQKSQMLADEQAAVTSALHTGNASQQFRIVRVRLQDGRTVVKKLSTAQISKLKKISTGTKPSVQVKNDSPPKSRIVIVDNLSASTTQKQLENMAKQMGKVERVKLNSETKRATVIFENTTSAAAFVHKFQRKMVDLSMISLRMVTSAEDISPVTTSTSSVGDGIGSTLPASSASQVIGGSSNLSLSVSKPNDQPKNVSPTKLPL
ncbi:uncharacterized protein isoform X2 [Rhodnius prolixus]|uniref:RRM domain-containing protein n=1 Tax=Rhodnius prolixus TaxID=13249 RepID=A0ABL0E500_RHOPR